MSIFALPFGVPNTTRQVVAGAGATTLVTVASNAPSAFVVGILVVNNTGGALTPVLDLYDGTTAFIIRDNTSIADQAREVVTLPEFIQMRPGDVLRITGGTGLSVFVSTVTPQISKAGAQ